MLKIIDIVLKRMVNNIWKTIEDLENYEVSDSGEVRNKNTKHLLVGSVDKGGYERVTLYNNGKKYSKLRHILVAKAFIPNTENKPCVDHIDTIRTNNAVTNLRWVTHKENANNELSRKHNSDAKTEWWKDESRREWMSESKKGENNPNWNKKEPKEITNKRIEPLKKKVYQYTIDGVLVAEYESCNEATRINGFSTGNLSRSCRSGRISYGYIWSYDRVQ